MRPPRPESRYQVGVDGAGFFCRAPKQAEQRIAFEALRAVYVETNDSGPWGMDVWWVLQGSAPDEELAFPLGATGEDQVLARLKELPDFEIQGMNSVSNAQFQCWPRAK